MLARQNRDGFKFKDSHSDRISFQNSSNVLKIFPFLYSAKSNDDRVGGVGRSHGK